MLRHQVQWLQILLETFGSSGNCLHLVAVEANHQKKEMGSEKLAQCWLYVTSIATNTGDSELLRV